MTSRRDAHNNYAELVAGHALHSLEPEDEETLLRHLGGCARCTRELAAAREVLGQLAYSVEPASPPAGLFERIRAEIESSDPGAFDEPAESSVAELAVVRRRGGLRFGELSAPARWVAAAACVALLAVGGLVAWNVSLVHDRNQAGIESVALRHAVEMLETTPSRTVPITDKATSQVTAVAVIRAGRVNLVVDGMQANDTSRDTYVLWGQDSGGLPYGVIAFDVKDSGVHVVSDAALTNGKMPDTFMITRESGRAMPAAPRTAVLMTGQSD